MHPFVLTAVSQSSANQHFEIIMTCFGVLVTFVAVLGAGMWRVGAILVGQTLATRANTEQILHLNEKLGEFSQRLENLEHIESYREGALGGSIMRGRPR